MKNLFTFLIVMISYTSFSQDNSLYLPQVYKTAYEKGTRSYDGKPGANYWTNHSEYNIKAEFIPETKKLTGTEEITYFNNSPDTLRYLTVKTLQDIYKKESSRDFNVAPDQTNDGVNISSLTVEGITYDLENRREVIRYGTNLYIILKEEILLNPKSSINFSITWDYTLIRDGFRTGAFSDSSFFVGYWYPQMAVYDDYIGWDNGNYTGGQETYNDLANFNVELTLPSNYIVWATGDLLNSKAIFSDEIYKKIEASKISKEVVNIITEKDYENEILKSAEKAIWKYNAKNVPDFAWATSNYYLWDATSAVSDSINNKTVWVNSIYPADNFQFKYVVDYAKSSIEYFSNVFPAIPYLYDKHFTFNGHHRLAMEFPMMANNCDADNEPYIFEITAHEIAHGYLPFYVQVNEREYAWIDEGFVKLFGEMALENHGVTRAENPVLNTIAIYSDLATTIFDVPLMTPSSSINPEFDFATTYSKTTNCLVYLNEIMLEKGIENPMKLFLETWKDKHPTPYDFFFFMNSLVGEDLSWFWKPWFFEFAAPDLSIKEVVQGSKSSKVVIENLGGLPIPVIIKITFDDNTTEIIENTASVWKSRNLYTENIISKKKITSVELGNDYAIDINPENNFFETK